jgi:hypothetical protein
LGFYFHSSHKAKNPLKPLGPGGFAFLSSLSQAGVEEGGDFALETKRDYFQKIKFIGVVFLGLSLICPMLEQMFIALGEASGSREKEICFSEDCLYILQLP